jgi:hypothetical protein
MLITSFFYVCLLFASYFMILTYFLFASYLFIIMNCKIIKFYCYTEMYGNKKKLKYFFITCCIVRYTPNAFKVCLFVDV